MSRARATRGRRALGAQTRGVTPLYHQMYLVLRQKIRDGELDGDKPLPGEHQLAEQFGVSRVTVRRTLDSLELEGLIQRRRGVGTFPVAQPVEFRDRYNIGGLTDPEARTGRAAETTTIEAGVTVLPAAVAARFGARHGEVLRIVRVRSFAGEPFTLMTAYIVPAYGERFSRRQMHSTAIPAALLEVGADLARAEQTISASLADELTARHLHVPVGSALIHMTTLFTDADDQPVAWIDALYRPDRYEYRTTMLRRGPSRRWQPVY